MLFAGATIAQAIFLDDADRKRYLEKLSLYCEESGARESREVGRCSVTLPDAMGRWDSRSWLDFFRSRSYPRRD
jgi:hypothetical protein